MVSRCVSKPLTALAGTLQRPAYTPVQAMSESAQLAALPIATHGQAVSRLSQADLLHFESMLATADDSIEACMRARARTAIPARDDSASAVLQAVVDAIAAVTDAPPPTNMASKTGAVAWVSSAIVEARDRAVRKATQNSMAPGMDPQTVGACMELISKLNNALGATQ